jgi:hypothetical protein
MGQASRCRLFEARHMLLRVVMHSRWRRPVALCQGEKPSSGPDPGSAKSSRIKTINSSGSGGIVMTACGVVDKAACPRVLVYVGDESDTRRTMKRPDTTPLAAFIRTKLYPRRAVVALTLILTLDLDLLTSMF